MSRTPAGVWAAVAAYRNRLDSGPSRPVVDEASNSHLSRELLATPSPLCDLCGDTEWYFDEFGYEQACHMCAPEPDPDACPTCNGYGWTVSIDGTRPYLNRVVPCPDCGGEAA